jgi:DNA-binding SARP family transcriptional activator/tetratricopeptide (TPR) repeat protein
MRFGILGPLQVHDGGAAVAVGPPKQRALLGVLLVHANQVISTHRLVELLWNGDPPAGAVRALHVYLSGLRKALRSGRPGRDDGELLVRRPPGYLLRVAPGALDLEEFERLVAEARRARGGGELAQAVRLLEEALDLWRGPALADVEVAVLQDTVVPRLEEARLAATEERIDIELALGRHAGLCGELQALVAEHPFRERLCGLLMLALYQSGRQAEALAVYRDARGRLVGELGVDPGAELQRLQRQILAADPALDGPPEVSASEPSSTGSQPWPVPRQLPTPIATFTGRAQELAQLDRTVTAQGSSGPVVISAIDGTGGIGKSALAIHYAHQILDRFPDGQLYVNLRGATAGLAPLTPLDALGRLLRALGVQPTRIPAQVEEAAGLFRSLAAGRRLLVVLDNAASVEQVRPLLPPSPTCAVLVTSRRVLAALEGAQVLHLDLLPQEQAVELLGRIAGPSRVASEAKAAAEVVRLCGYLPLAIQIAGARLAARPTWPVGELAGRLADATGRLEELAAGDLAVQASFEVSLRGLRDSADPLDRAAAAGFGLLGLPDGPDLGVPAAARLLEGPERTARVLLERLVDAQLLQTPRPGRYQFHDLVRLYARQQATRQHPEAERLAALERLVGFYTATAWHTLKLLRPGDQRLASADSRWTGGGLDFPDAAAALAWLETERGNLLAAIKQTATVAPAVPAKLATELTRALFGLFEVHNHWTDGMQANQTALELARRIGDLSGQTHAHSDLSFVYERLGRYQEALDHLQQALPLFRQLGDRHGQAATLGNLGIIYSRLERSQEALDHLQQALSLGRQLGARRGQAATLGNLGIVYQALGRPQEALNHLQQALTLFRQLGDRHGQAEDLNNLGMVYGRMGRYQEAFHHHRQAVALFLELGDRHGQAMALRDLGDALIGAGQPQRAREEWQQALELCQALAPPEAAQLRSRLGIAPR